MVNGQWRLARAGLVCSLLSLVGRSARSSMIPTFSQVQLRICGKRSSVSARGRWMFVSCCVCDD